MVKLNSFSTSKNNLASSLWRTQYDKFSYAKISHIIKNENVLPENSIKKRANYKDTVRANIEN